MRYNTKLVSSIDSPQENIGDELFLDENITTDDNFENVEFDDDKISISSVEETSKMLAKRKFVPSKLSSFFNPVPKQAKTSFDHAAPSNPTVLTDTVDNPTVYTDAGVHEAWTDHARERDKARKREAERMDAKLAEWISESVKHINEVETLRQSR